MNLEINSNDIVCGIMTGTSLDGVDIAFSKFDINNSLKIELLGYSTLPYPPSFSNYVKQLISNPNWRDISFLNYFIAELYQKAILFSANRFNLNISDIKLIGIHGQTMWHEPNGIELFNSKIPSTLQIGNASVLATKMGIPVVSDFRAADMALGGQGAPLVPRFDYDYFKSNNDNIVCLNIGGMANITYLPENSDIKDVIAFDTGPGNVLIDLIMKKYFNKEYDSNGEIARLGKINEILLESLLNDDFVKCLPPKSTGREYYNEEYLNKYNINGYDQVDILHTLTHFTSKSIEYNIKQFCKKVDKIIVSGGGVRNLFLMEILQSLFPSILIETSEDYKIPIDAKEAIAFAYMAYRTVNGLPSNIPSVTGASREAILGSLSFPF